MEIVSVYVNGLPNCRAPSYPLHILDAARLEKIKLACSLEEDQAQKTICFLKKHGYNAYIRKGENREDLCDYSGFDDDGPTYDPNERWFPNG